MSADQAFLNNVVLQIASTFGVALLHLWLITAVNRVSPAVGESKALAFPKFEVAWFLATYEGTVMVSVFVFALGDSADDSLSMHELLLVLAALVIIGIVALIFFMTSKVHRRLQVLKSSGSLTYVPHQAIPTVLGLYREFSDEARGRRSSSAVKTDIVVVSGESVESAADAVSTMIMMDEDIPEDPSKLELLLQEREEPQEEPPDYPPDAMPDVELLAAADSLGGGFTFNTLLGQLLANRRQIELDGLQVDPELQKKIDHAATVRVQAAARRLVCRKAAREAREHSTVFGGLTPRPSGLHVPSLSKLLLKDVDKKPSSFLGSVGKQSSAFLGESASAIAGATTAGVMGTAAAAEDVGAAVVHEASLSVRKSINFFEQGWGSAPPSPPGSPPSNEYYTTSTKGEPVAAPTTETLGELLAQRRRRRSSSVVRVRQSVSAARHKIISARKSLKEAWTPFEEPLPNPEELSPSGPARVATKLANRSSKVWGIRRATHHTAAALGWYESLTDDQKKRLAKAAKMTNVAVKKRGHWKVQNRKVPREEVQKATQFIGGYGELFQDKNQGDRCVLFPNHLYFVVDLLLTTLKVIFVVGVTDPNVQMALIILVDTLGLIIFVIQRPLTDYYLCFDLALSKFINLLSFCVLTQLEDPDYSQEEGMLHTEAGRANGEGTHEEGMHPVFRENNRLVAIVMDANMIVLYWMIAMQLIRQIMIAVRAIFATLAFVSCCGGCVGLTAKGKITPKKLLDSESRTEVIDVLKPETMKVMKAGMALKRAVSSVGDDSDGEEEEEGMAAIGMLSAIGQGAAGAGLKEKLKEQMKPMVEQAGMPWVAVERLIDEVDSQEELEAAMADPHQFLQNAALALALDVAVHKLKQKLKPITDKRQLPWAVVEAQIDALDSVEELEAALEDVDVFLLKVADAAVIAMVELLKQKLKPVCEARGLPWEVVEPPIDELDTLQELQQALSDGEAFLDKVLETAVPTLVAMLKAKLQPYCEKMGLPWEVVEPPIDELDTAQELQAAIADFDAFLAKALASSVAGLITLLKGKIQPYCEDMGLPWAVVEPAIDAVDTVEELQAAIADMDTFLTNVLASSIVALVALFKGKVRPICEARGLPWFIIEPPIDALDTADKVKEAISDLDRWLEELVESAHEAFVAYVKDKVRVICELKRFPWVLIEPPIDALDTPAKIQAALANIEGFLANCLKDSIPALVSILKDLIKPILEKRNLPWEIIEPYIDELDTAAEIQAAIAGIDDFIKRTIVACASALKAKFKMKLKELCELKRFPWELIEPPIDALDTPAKIQAALANIEGFLANCLKDSIPALKRLLTDKLRTICESKGLSWHPVEAAVNKLDSTAELRSVLANPTQFLGTLGGVAQAAAGPPRASQLAWLQGEEQSTAAF